MSEAVSKRKILFYDLEDVVTTFLEKEFQQAELTVLKAAELEEAFNLLSEEQPDIVLTDTNTKSKSSIQFLTRIKEEYPTVSRAILCDSSEHVKMINLMMRSIITCYFEKPDGFGLLLESFLNIVKVREILKNKKLLNLMNAIDRLPVFPAVYQEFIDGIESDESLKKISHIIEKDVSLATSVLQIANSGFYGNSRIGSVERACIYLGMETIKNIVFTASMGKAKDLTEKQNHYLGRIIQHSLKTNQNFQRFYKSETGRKPPDDFASIGLTHDIGKIIMLQYLPDRLKKVIKYQRKNPDISFYRSEIELGFEGCTHSEIGAYFLELWGFPETNITTALFHHTPELASEIYFQLLDIFELADKLAREV